MFRAVSKKIFDGNIGFMIVAFNTIQLKGIIGMSRAYVSKSLFEDDIYMWGLVFIKQNKNMEIKAF